MKDIKQAAFILIIALSGVYAWDYYDAITWEQKANITLRNGEKLYGMLSWNTASKESYKLVLGAQERVIPKDDIRIIAFMH